jgi:hypothetical protein
LRKPSGWRFAAGFIAVLFLQELGHYVAAQCRRRSVPFV